MDSAEDTTVVATYVFRGIEYVVSMNVLNGRDTLVVEVEDKLTADQWRGSFDSAYIEDLTHKTGNYKQFPIFVSMLESGLTQSSDAVSLDLLTYADLESLRNHKAGAGTRNIPGAKTASLNSKRYLILTYTVEFDRIHYPLPLPYMGKPDPRALQDTIRQLRNELKSAKQHTSKDYRLREMDKLKKDYERLLAEKEELEDKYITFKREVSATSVGSAAKEVRLLKAMVKSLQEELMTEKSKYQRQSSKRSDAYRQLQDEADELRASERNLRARVKSLTNELALYKRGGRPGSNRSGTSSFLRGGGSLRSSRENSFNSQRSAASRERSVSRQNSFERSRNGSIGSARERSLDRLSNRSASRGTRTSLDRRRSTSLERGRSSSIERPRTDRSRDRFRDSSLERSRDGSLGGGNRSRTSSTGSYRSRASSPSCAGARYPRFDPTNFVKEREQKKREAEIKKKRLSRGRPPSVERKSRPAPLSDRNIGRQRITSRSSSAGSFRSRTSSIESLSDIMAASDSSQGRRRYPVEGTKRHTNGSRKQPEQSSNGMLSSPDVSYSKAGHKGNAKKTIPLASTPDSQTSKTKSRTAWEKENKAPSKPANDSDYFDRSAEISEIDERLNRLQEFMKTTLGQ